MLNTFRQWLIRVLTAPVPGTAGNHHAVEDVPYRSTSSIFPYDENLLERSRTQWQFGDWASLAAISRDTLQHHPDRAKLALLAAAAHAQQGQGEQARQFTRMAQDWGCSKKLISQVLISGVHNTLGRASASGGQQARALKHFGNSIALGNPGGETTLLAQARTTYQIHQLGLTLPGDYIKVGSVGMASWAHSRSLTSEISAETTNAKYANFSSSQYWEERYKKGGTSGFGSYGRLAEFKAEVINKFIEDKEIERVIEFGCGDGNQLSMLSITNYVGVDISPTIIQKCKEKYTSDPGKTFFTNDEFRAAPFKADLSLSLDVIFHLIEDDVFEAHMNTIFGAAERFCIIYASNDKGREDPASHVRHRLFTKWIEANKCNWRLAQTTYNKYPHDDSRNPRDLSFSDFYFYERV